jgi:hypothetical protein
MSLLKHRGIIPAQWAANPGKSLKSIRSGPACSTGRSSVNGLRNRLGSSVAAPRGWVRVTGEPGQGTERWESGVAPPNLRPEPGSRVPIHKNEGASGDMYENKGMGKMPLMIAAPSGESACAGDSISRPRIRAPFPLSRVPCPDSQK